jgi:hypothetical protein
MWKTIGCTTAVFVSMLSYGSAAEVLFEGQVQTDVDPSCFSNSFSPEAGQSGYFTLKPAGEGDNGPDTNLTIYVPRPSGAPPYVSAHVLLENTSFTTEFQRAKGTVICTEALTFRPLVRATKVREYNQATYFEFAFKRWFGISSCTLKGEGVMRLKKTQAISN